MSWFKKKSDPISDRARALNKEIAALEARIKALDSKVQRSPAPPQSAVPDTPSGLGAPASTPANVAPQPGLATDASTPRPLRSTVQPQRAAHGRPFPSSNPATPEPIFEKVDRGQLKGQEGAQNTRELYNDLGVRKYDLPALWRRFRDQFRGPSTTNPKLVSYLAAGGIQGLKPLRYEKRVARNRFIALVVFLFLMLLGIILVFVKHR
jgi:hypothetical protein